MASAVSRTVWSSTLSPKWFQLFQPIGGVRARPFAGTGSSAGNGMAAGGFASASGTRTAVASSEPVAAVDDRHPQLVALGVQVVVRVPIDAENGVGSFQMRLAQGQIDRSR